MQPCSAAKHILHNFNGTWKYMALDFLLEEHYYCQINVIAFCTVTARDFRKDSGGEVFTVVFVDNNRFQLNNIFLTGYSLNKR